MRPNDARGCAVFASVLKDASSASISIEARHIAPQRQSPSKFARNRVLLRHAPDFERGTSDYSRHTMAGFGGALPGGIGEMAKSLTSTTSTT